MADLTIGKLTKATAPTVVADSMISESAATITIANVDGVGVIPPNLPHGMAITQNNGGYGDIDFWNLTPGTADGEGFAFHQKFSDGTDETFVAMYWFPGGAEIDLQFHNPTNIFENWHLASSGESNSNFGAGITKKNFRFDNVDALTLNSDLSAVFAGRVSQGAPGIDPTQGISSLSAEYNEIACFGNYPATDDYIGISHYETSGYLFTSGASGLNISSGDDIVWVGDDGAAGVVPTSLRVLGNVVGAGGYEFAYAGDWGKTANVATFGTDKTDFGVARDVSFVYGGVEQMRLTATGIATPGPLNVTEGLVTAKFDADTTRGYIGTTTSHPFVITTLNAARITLAAAGNVGIGDFTAGSPAQALLHVGKTSASARIYNAFPNATDSEWSYLGDWNADISRFGTDKTGAGVARAIQWLTGGIVGLAMDTAQRIALGTAAAFTAAFPMLKRVATELQFRLGDDSAYAPIAVGTLAQAGNEFGGRIEFRSLTELTTIANTATTSTTIQIPAGAVVFAVSTRVTIAIPSAATFGIGVTGTATRYGTGISTAANTTSPGTLAGPLYYASATALLITPVSTPPNSNGRLRVTIHYYICQPPTS